MERIKRSDLICLSLLALILVVSLQPRFVQAGEQSDLPDLKVFAKAVEVSDEALAQMRGRFVNAGRVLQFGVEMYTQWLMPSGNNHTAGLSFGVDLMPGFRPTVSIFSLGSAARTISHGGTDSATPPTSDGINRIDGVAQANQIAGNFNNVGNDVQLDIHRASEAASTGNPMGEPVTGRGHFSLLEDGVMTRVHIDTGSLGFSMEAPGKGQVAQRIRSDGPGGARGLLQRTQLTSDLNRITNLTRIVVGVSGSASARTDSIRSALDQL